MRHRPGGPSITGRRSLPAWPWPVSDVDIIRPCPHTLTSPGPLRRNAGPAPANMATEQIRKSCAFLETLPCHLLGTCGDYKYLRG